MNLVVDVGNTMIKAAVFQQHELELTIVFKEVIFQQEFEKIFKRFPDIKQSLIISVKGNVEAYQVFLKKKSKVRLLDLQTKLPFNNNYHSPETLGVDRIALAAAAVEQFPRKNVLIIDAGTCITYDFVDVNGIYHGGAISPGLQMRLDALHNFTAKLPLLQLDKAHKVDVVGRNTEESMQLGAIGGAAYEIDGFATVYKENHEDLTIILTGGDREILSKSVKNSIFVDSNFLLKGLNSILEFNKT